MTTTDLAPRAPDDAGPPPPRTWLTQTAAAAVAGYLLVRVIGVLFLWLWADDQGQNVLTLLGYKYDSVHYLDIVENGYDRAEAPKSTMAFFPLYPMLVAGLAAITPLSAMGAGIAVAWLAGVAAAWGVYTVGRHLRDHRTGVLLAVLWGVLPHAIVESMAYTESLFTALAAWSLYAVLTQRWLTAGVLCLFAGLTRPTATALIAAVGLAALITVFQRPTNWRAWLAGLLAPLGWLGYLTWVAIRTGRPDGWFWIEHEGWFTGWDGGTYTWRFVTKVLSTPSHVTFYVVTLVMLISLALFTHTVADRLPWPLLLFSAILLITTIGGDGMYNAKARFLLVAFPLLIPIAVALARARPTNTWITLTTLTTVSAYFGGHLLMVWHISP
ncbi:hypothetical protein ACFPM7_27025 [Actinokineospora guangxiensis]|uniref:Dolichyl-phosphate-mannose-protein mannosyltransferase n=1 Tax=Actinokineospora guangxiensis TaxID=1490288 RepID=A0ABW0EXS5_9PSEU